MNDHDIDRLHREADKIKDQMMVTRREIHDARAALVEQRLDRRTMPPMAQMTRIQKRYFLEPWMTTLAVVFTALGSIALGCAMFTPWHVEFGCLGSLLWLIAGAFAVMKWNFMEWNQKTEGQIRPPSSNIYYDR